MNKWFFLMLLAVVLLTASCAVDSTNGAVTVINHTNRTASNLKLGNYYIGHVYPGVSRTVFFYTEKSAVKIICEDFDPTYGAISDVVTKAFDGTINLKRNYNYVMHLRYSKTANVYYIEMEGSEVGADVATSQKITKD